MNPLALLWQRQCQQDAWPLSQTTGPAEGPEGGGVTGPPQSADMQVRGGARTEGISVG